MTTVRCSCYLGLATPDLCPVHGQRTPETATGTPRVGEAQSVPVVDITATIRGLYEHAEEVRERRHAFLNAAADLGASYAREADYLEGIARTLINLTGGDDR